MYGSANTVVMVGIQSRRRLHWFMPKNLNGREPMVFNLMVTRKVFICRQDPTNQGAN